MTKIIISNNEHDKEIIHNQINQLIYSNIFKILFKIMEKGLIKCLKYGYIYLLNNDKNINEIIFHLEKENEFDNKCVNLINILNILFDLDIKFKRSSSTEKFLSINSILNKANCKYKEPSIIRDEINTKIRTLNIIF